MRSCGLHRLACLLLALLFCAGALQVADASRRLMDSYAVLARNNPVTHQSNELICESSPPSQAGIETGPFTRLSVRVSGSLAADSTDPPPDTPALSSGITRSPPPA
jgi:hypothetical protein